MNSMLLKALHGPPSQLEIEASVDSVTRYLIRCGIRDTTYLREQSRCVVESRLAAFDAPECPEGEVSLDSDSGTEAVAIADRSAVRSVSFEQQCLQEATATMRALLDRSANQQQTPQKLSIQSESRQSKQFAFLGTDDLLFTSQAFSRDAVEDSSASSGVTQPVAMVIPPAELRHFKRNATPDLIGPMRLSWWKLVLASWIPWSKKAGMDSIQRVRRPSKMQASQSDA